MQMLPLAGLVINFGGVDEVNPANADPRRRLGQCDRAAAAPISQS
jgi:hypothetical protein